MKYFSTIAIHLLLSFLFAFSTLGVFGTPIDSRTAKMVMMNRNYAIEVAGMGLGLGLGHHGSNFVVREALPVPDSSSTLNDTTVNNSSAANTTSLYPQSSGAVSAQLLASAGRSVPFAMVFVTAAMTLSLL